VADETGRGVPDEKVVGGGRKVFEGEIGEVKKGALLARGARKHRAIISPQRSALTTKGPTDSSRKKGDWPWFLKSGNRGRSFWVDDPKQKRKRIKPWTINIEQELPPKVWVRSGPNRRRGGGGGKLQLNIPKKVKTIEQRGIVPIFTKGGTANEAEETITRTGKGFY